MRGYPWASAAHHYTRGLLLHPLRHPALVSFLVKLLTDLTEPHDGDPADRVVNALTKLTPVLR